MQSYTTPNEAGAEAAASCTFESPAAWRPIDEAVQLLFTSSSDGSPHALRWRGSTWRIISCGPRWSTWRALPIAQAHSDEPATTRGVRTEFRRFAAHTNPVAPVFHFEVRRSGTGWRLVRIGVAFDLPPLT